MLRREQKEDKPERLDMKTKREEKQKRGRTEGGFRLAYWRSEREKEGFSSRRYTSLDTRDSPSTDSDGTQRARGGSMTFHL
mmetsp:Transcript_40910/g.47037  ORF Transcript_40910/g.47037 Transcript_40910/m.47037 type:complete len:81 (-) Transcript_40910:990-1232(-)